MHLGRHTNNPGQRVKCLAPRCPQQCEFSRRWRLRSILPTCAATSWWTCAQPFREIANPHVVRHIGFAAKVHSGPGSETRVSVASPWRARFVELGS